MQNLEWKEKRAVDREKEKGKDRKKERKMIFHLYKGYES